MRASLVFYGMGCLVLLLLPVATALSVVPDELTRTIRQGQIIVFHLRGNPNETLTLSTDHIAAEGVAVTVPLGRTRLNANGTADFPLRIEGDLAAVGRWQLRVANATMYVNVFYEVDWDPVFLLEKEAANLALQQAFWTRIETFVLWMAIALILTWIGLRLWHEWSHVRPTYLGKRIAAILGRLRSLASVTEMGLQIAESNPDFVNRAAFNHTRRNRKRRDRAIMENLDRLRGMMNERRAGLEAETVYRDRVLANNPRDPLVNDFVEDPGMLEETVKEVYKELWPEGDDAASG